MKTALLILIFNSLAFAQEKSLADVARQERARQKSVTSKVTVTNETLGTTAALPPSPEPQNKAAESAKSPDASAGALADVKTDAKTNELTDEASWRAAFSKAREELKRAEDRTQVLQLELNKLNLDLLTRSDIYNREGQIVPLINAKNTELAASEMAASDARQKITQLENDLRRSGNPIGWSR